MTNLALVLKLTSPVFLAVGVLHLVFGVGADVMLGANLPAEALRDPVLDSQNRFYGTVFTLYGVVLYICSTDIRKYIVILRSTLLVFFAGGVARIVSIAIYGLPSAMVLALLATELLLPPLILWWLTKKNLGS